MPANPTAIEETARELERALHHGDRTIILFPDQAAQLLSLAKLGQMVREGGEEVVEKVARSIFDDDKKWDRFSDGHRDAWRKVARAVLRTLKDLGNDHGRVSR